MRIIHHYSGKSLLELREQFGIGEKGFYNNSWWLEEDFAKEKLPVDDYEIEFHPEWNNLTSNEQKEKMTDGYDFCPPAILAEAVLEYCQKTGKRLLETWWSRTNTVDSFGGRVRVGYFVAKGLHVHSDWDDRRYVFLGASSARKLTNKSVKKEIQDMKQRIAQGLTYMCDPAVKNQWSVCEAHAELIIKNEILPFLVEKLEKKYSKVRKIIENNKINL